MTRLLEGIEAFLELGGTKKDITLLVISAIALGLSFFEIPVFPFDAAWLAIILCGLPIVLEALIGLITRFDIKADVLVSLALIAAVFIGENFAAGEVAVIMQLGALLEDMTVAKARAGIERLVHLTPQTARVWRGGREVILPAEEVCVHDVIRVLPGEAIPVDGVITEGETAVNQAVMTGESLPVDKTVGDTVASGTVNQFGAFTMEATKVGADSSMQRMIALVQSADAGKAKIVGIADRWATWIVVGALTTAVLTYLVTGEIIRAVTILVVFCPCALVLATPTAIMAGIGNVTKHGFLVRAGDALERVAQISHIAFDKTGTLTYGKPEVVATYAIPQMLADDVLYRYVAAAEASSEHPLGKAVVASFRAARPGVVLPPASSFQAVVGRGVTAVVEGKTVAVGNQTLAEELQISIPKEVQAKADAFIAKGCTIMYGIVDGVLCGFIALADTVREDSTAMISRLKGLAVQPVLLTGDNPQAAQTIAGGVGITDVHAQCFPEDKLQWIQSYQQRQKQVCMIGDGINDAPALKMADVGIAMGGIGSDIAVEAADMVLVNDDIKELPHVVALARRMMKTIKVNMAFSLVLNFIAVVLAVAGILHPVIGALVHNAGSVFVIIHSSLLLNWKYGK